MRPHRLRHKVIALLLPLFVLLALAPERAGARSADGARPSLSLAPSARFQTHVFSVPAPVGACAPFRKSGPCKLIVAVELRGRGVEPMGTGSRLLTGPHVQTGYAAMSVCLSAETRTGKGNCNSSIPYCGSGPQPNCGPSWNARVATEYQYNGRTVQRIWLDPSGMGAIEFIVRSTRSFSLPKVNPHGSLPIGQDITVTGSTPATRTVKLALRLRMTVSPAGRVTYTVQ